MQPRPETTRGTGSGRSLLELDPQLGQLQPTSAARAAEHELRLRVSVFPIGEWDGRAARRRPTPSHLGLLVAPRRPRARGRSGRHRQHRTARAPATSIRPWARGRSAREMLPVDRPLERASPIGRAWLDRRVASRARPAIPRWSAVIVDRLFGARAAAGRHAGDLPAQPRGSPPAGAVLAPCRALGPSRPRRHRGPAGALPPADRRAGRRAPADGLDRARQTARDGQLSRRDDGTWLLTGEPVSAPPEGAAEVIRQRRRLMPSRAEESADARPGELRASMHE